MFLSLNFTNTAAKKAVSVVGLRGYIKNDQVNALARIYTARPDLIGAPVKICKPAKVCAFIIGEEVFKISPGLTLFKEVYRYEAMSGHGLPVPSLTYKPDSLEFFGMSKVSGVMLKEVIKKMTARELRLLGQDMADFQIGVDKVFSRGVRRQLVTRENDSRGGFPFYSLQSVLCALSSEQYRPIASDRYSQVENRIVEFFTGNRPLIYAHADMNTENVFVDPVTKRLTAVVDFEYVEEWKTERMLMMMKRLYPDVVTKALCDRMLEKAPDKWKDRDIAAYRFCHELMENRYNSNKLGTLTEALLSAAPKREPTVKARLTL